MIFAPFGFVDEIHKSQKKNQKIPTGTEFGPKKLMYISESGS